MKFKTDRDHIRQRNLARQNHAFKIVAIGEDFAAVMRAHELSKELVTDLEPEFGLRINAWKFEALLDCEACPLGGSLRGMARHVLTGKADRVVPPLLILPGTHISFDDKWSTATGAPDRLLRLVNRAAVNTVTGKRMFAPAGAYLVLRPHPKVGMYPPVQAAN